IRGVSDRAPGLGLDARPGPTAVRRYAGGVTDLHERIRAWWDEDASTYDLAPSHAMTDPVEAACWRALLRRLLPAPPANILDVGAGTGAISLLAAELGHSVTALDLSPAMLGRTEEKARALGRPVRIVIGRAE